MANDLIPSGPGFFLRRALGMKEKEIYDPPSKEVVEAARKSRELLIQRAALKNRSDDRLDLARKVDGILKINRYPEMRIVFFCTMGLEPFLMVTERRENNVLHTKRSERLTPSGLQGDLSSLEEMADFDINTDVWPGCAICGAETYGHGTKYWWSGWCKCKGKLQCVGSMISGHRTCVCGTVHSDKFTSAKTVPVIGLLPTINVRGS